MSSADTLIASSDTLTGIEYEKGEMGGAEEEGEGIIDPSSIMYPLFLSPLSSSSHLYYLLPTPCMHEETCVYMLCKGITLPGDVE